MSLTKRMIIFLSSCMMIVLIMSAVLEDAPRAEAVFAENSHTLMVIDSQSLLPISDCDIIIIGESSSYKTDSSGKFSLNKRDASIIAAKDGFAPHILLHHDFTAENAVISLVPTEDSSVTASVDSEYARKLIESYLYD